MSADGHVAWTWVFANYILGKDYMLTIEQQENLYHIKPLVSGALFMHNIFQLLDISLEEKVWFKLHCSITCSSCRLRAPHLPDLGNRALFVVIKYVLFFKISNFMLLTD